MTTGTFAVFLPLVCILEHTAGHCIEITNEYQVCAEHYCCCSKRTRSHGVPKSSRFFVVAATIPIAGPTYCLSGIYNYIWRRYIFYDRTLQRQ